jgi:RNA polymerase sigma-B factor
VWRTPVARPLLAALPTHERRNLTVRFYDEMTQARIAAEASISQMPVSRLLKWPRAQLRIGLLTSADAVSEEGPTHARR